LWSGEAQAGEVGAGARHLGRVVWEMPSGAAHRGRAAQKKAAGTTAEACTTKAGVPYDGLRQQSCRYDSRSWYYEGRSSVRWAETAMG
jgi:hypothetical protein